MKWWEIGACAGGYAAFAFCAGLAWYCQWTRRNRPAQNAVPGLPSDGRPLDGGEWEDLAGLFHGLPRHLQNAWPK